MLTVDYIIKVARLMEQTGGYGDRPEPRSPLQNCPKRNKLEKDVIRLSLNHVEDKKTGDVRLVSKVYKHH